MKLKREHKLKIIAFLISATLWYLIVWGKPIEKTLEAPIIVKSAQDKELYVEINPSTVAIKVLATRSQLRNLNKDQVNVEIDLEKYPPGIHQVRIPVEQIRLTNTMKVKEVSPSFVTVVIRKISQKKVPVVLNLKDRIEQRDKRFKLVINPPVVTIRGFWEDIKDIENIYTEEVSLARLKKEKYLNVELIPPQRVIELEPRRVKIVYSSF